MQRLLRWVHPGKKKIHHLPHPINKRRGGSQAGSWLRDSAAWTRGPTPSGKYLVRIRPSPCSAGPSSISSDTNLLSPTSEWIQVTQSGHLQFAPCIRSQGGGCWCQPGKVLQRPTDGQRESGTGWPPWQCQTRLARRSMRFSLAAGLARIWGCLGFREHQAWLCCVRKSSLSTRAIAGWVGGHCYAPSCTPKSKDTHVRAGEVREVSCGSLEAHGQRGQNCRWKTSPRYVFLARCSQGDRSCTSKVQDNPCPLQRPLLQGRVCPWLRTSPSNACRRSCQGKLIPSRQQSCEG